MDYFVSISHAYLRTITIPAGPLPSSSQTVNQARPLAFWATTELDPSPVTTLAINTTTLSPVATITIATADADVDTINRALAAYGYTPITTDADGRHHTSRDATLDDLIAVLGDTHPDINDQARAWLDTLPELTADPHTPDRWLTRRTDDTDYALIWNTEHHTWERD